MTVFYRKEPVRDGFRQDRRTLFGLCSWMLARSALTHPAAALPPTVGYGSAEEGENGIETAVEDHVPIQKRQIRISYALDYRRSDEHRERSRWDLEPSTEACREQTYTEGCRPRKKCKEQCKDDPPAVEFPHEHDGWVVNQCERGS